MEYYPICDGTETFRHFSKKENGKPICGAHLWRILPCPESLKSFDDCPECRASIGVEDEREPSAVQLELFENVEEGLSL